MKQLEQRIDTPIATQFLRQSFGSAETIAIVVRKDSWPIAQRIVRLETALEPRYLSWLAHENAAGANVYVSANPLMPGSRKRTKDSIAQIRHLYIDLDTDGTAKLDALKSSDRVPVPTSIVSTSAGKYQVLWRVEDCQVEQQELLLKALSVAFGGDLACTDSNRVLRLPGFLNRKYDPSPLVSVEFPCNLPSRLADFQLDIAKVMAELPRDISARKPSGKRTNSEQDWTWIFRELSRGTDPQKLTRTLAEHRSDEPNPRYYAQRTVDVASAWLWLKDGFPFADVVTMLQIRRRFEFPSSLCSARAHEIAFTAQRMVSRKKIA